VRPCLKKQKKTKISFEVGFKSLENSNNVEFSSLVLGEGNWQNDYMKFKYLWLSCVLSSLPVIAGHVKGNTTESLCF
jgi:hypothetical protein